MPDYPQSSPFSLCVALTGPIHMSFRTSRGHRMVFLLQTSLAAHSLSFWFPILLVGPSQLSNPLLLLPSVFPSCLLQAGKPDLQVCYHCMQSKSKQAPRRGPGASKELSTKALIGAQKSLISNQAAPSQVCPLSFWLCGCPFTHSLTTWLLSTWGLSRAEGKHKDQSPWGDRGTKRELSCDKPELGQNWTEGKRLGQRSRN